MAAESKYQTKLKKKLEAEGYLVIRLVTATSSISNTGIPDLLALKPCDDGRAEVRFIEVKAKKGVVSPIQKYVMKKLNQLGFRAEVKRENDEL